MGCSLERGWVVQATAKWLEIACAFSSQHVIGLFAKVAAAKGVCFLRERRLFVFAHRR